MLYEVITLDSGDGLEADFDGDMDGGDEAFQLFSFRNLVNFLLGFVITSYSIHYTKLYDNLCSGTPLSVH